MERASLRRALRSPKAPSLALVLCGILLSLTVMGAAALMIAAERRSALANTGRELANTAWMLAGYTERALEAVELVNRHVRERIAGEGLFTEDALRDWAIHPATHFVLREQAGALRQVQGLDILDSHGRYLATSSTWPAPTADWSDQPFFRALQDGAETSVSEPVRDPARGDLALVMARRIAAPDGSFLGATMAKISLSYFTELYGGLALEPDTSIVLAHRSGPAMARFPDIPHAVGRPLWLLSQGFMDLPQEQRMGVNRVPSSALDGRERLSVGRPVADYPLWIFASKTSDTAMAAWRRSTAWLATGAALLVATVWAAFGFAILHLRGQARYRREERLALAEQQRLHAELYSRETRFRATVEGMSQGVWMFDAEGRLAIANGRCAEMLGIPPALLEGGATLPELIGSVARNPAATRALERLADMAAAGSPASSMHELGGGQTVALVHQPLHGGGWIATFEDISARRAAEERAVYNASHDALTGLPNRRALHERFPGFLSRAAGSAGQLALIHFGLDRFKAVNDSLGSLIGDAVLRAAARRLTSGVRVTRQDSDLLVRIGGDEFAVVTHPNLRLGADAAADSAAMARRLIAALSEPYEVDGHQVVLGASAGIALFPVDGSEAHEIANRASLALAHAKANGGGEISFFRPEMSGKAEARRALEAEMRQALAAGEAHGFEIHYQPILRAASRRLRGFEALIRWRHPVRGLVPPGDFIPLAEELHLIGDIGRIALWQACREAASWPDELSVAVNLSPLQFRDAGLVAAVAAALDDTGLAPERLELEITEGVLLQATAEVLETLHRLRALGVRIALDDFGAGYSSLGYLRDFPIDKVKIDRAFVRDMVRRPADAAIVRAVVGLCGSLGMTVTVEGVESEEQLALIGQDRCAEVQGFLFSQPVPAADLAALMARFRVRVERSPAS